MRSEFLSALLLLAAPVLSSPTPGGKDSDDCYKTVKAGQSIQAAIDKARPGDQITVEKGTYSEQLTIKKNDITLIGKNAVLVPPKTFGKNLCSGLNKDFTGVDTEAGICIQGDVQLAPFVQEHRKFISANTYIKNVVVTGFEVRNFTGENIAVVGGQDVKITDNNLIDGAQYGFLTVGSKNTLAANNKVQSVSRPLGFIAMCMDDQFDAKFKNNDISGYYIALCTQTPGGVQKENTVKNCCVGPYVDPGVKGAKIIGNYISGRNPACPTSADPQGAAGAGIILSGSINTIVEKNTIEKISYNGASNDTGVGIFINDDAFTGTKASGNIIKRNTFQLNDFDIFNNGTATDNVISNNKCTPAKAAPGTNYCDA